MEQQAGLQACHRDASATTNRNFRITGWNSAAQMMYGWLCAEAKGKNMDELLQTKYCGTTLAEVYSALLADGFLELEVLHTTREGTVLQVLDRITLLRDSNAQVTGTMHTFMDMTSFMDIDGELDEPQEYLPVTQTANSDEQWTYDVPEDERWHASTAVHPDDRDRVEAIVKAAMADRQEQFKLQYRILDGNDAYAWFLTQGKIRYDDNRPVRITGTTVDISELKGLELQLQLQVQNLERQVLQLTDKNRLITDFFTNISHEFKTPLSIILVDLQLMEYRLRDSPDMKEKLGKTVVVMRQNALRLLRLVGNLLDVTKIEAGFMKTRLVNVDIVGLVSSLTESVQEYARSTGIAVSFQCTDTRKDTPMDSEKLERIMLNLLSNAIKHTPSGGHILVRLAVTADYMLISVKDDGEGISEQKKDFIFDRFRQANTSLAKATEGCGIGLALTKALVELLHGKIWFVSEAGQGSEFFVKLPVLQADWQAASLEMDGMTRDRKVEMEFSDIAKIDR
jgi:PAS domain S-box-containing protein